MKSNRLPRFNRSRTVPAIHLTERDRKIMELVHWHRFLRSSDIISLMEASPQQVLRRLQLLYHHGYVERPRCQLDFYYRGGSRQIVYGLGNHGAEILREAGILIPEVRWSEKNRAVGRVQLEHWLMVSKVMVAIELACRRTGVRLVTADELLLKDGKSQRFRWRVNVSSGLKLGVIPDEAFALDFPGEEGERKRAFFFLEADRGTMPVIRKNLSQTSLYRKFLSYEATWTQGIHRTNFGFNRFRVLTVTTSAARVKSLVDACSHLRTGHGLFLFTDRTALDNPDLLFSRIWRTARDGGMARIVE